MNASTRRIAEFGGITRRLEPEGYVFHQGDEVATVYLLLSGAIRLARLTLSGLEITLADIRPGDSFGETEVLLGVEYRESFAQAVRPSEILPIPVRDLSPSNIAELRLQALDRLYRTQLCLAEMMAETPSRRVANLLRLLAADDPAIDLTHEELGRRAGCSRETVTKALKHLQEAGAVDAKRSSVTVLKPERLCF